jgi:hypothetical protein
MVVSGLIQPVDAVAAARQSRHHVPRRLRSGASLSVQIDSSRRHSDMNILAAIRREERKLEKQARRLQKQLDGLRAAANALGESAMDGAGRMQKRVLSAEARAKISKAAKRRWAKVRAGARKAAS